MYCWIVVKRNISLVHVFGNSVSEWFKVQLTCILNMFKCSNFLNAHWVLLLKSGKHYPNWLLLVGSRNRLEHDLTSRIVLIIIKTELNISINKKHNPTVYQILAEVKYEETVCAALSVYKCWYFYNSQFVVSSSLL